MKFFLFFFYALTGFIILSSTVHGADQHQRPRRRVVQPQTYDCKGQRNMDCNINAEAGDSAHCPDGCICKLAVPRPAGLGAGHGYCVKKPE